MRRRRWICCKAEELNFRSLHYADGVSSGREDERVAGRLCLDDLSDRCSGVCNNRLVNSGPGAVVGIDFGTTNSSIGLVVDGDVHMVPFPALAGVSASSRSLLYLQRQMQKAGKPVLAWTGVAGIEHYLETDTFDDAVQGRLIQSLKSYLSSRNLTGTEIFGRQYQFEELVARILRDLRLRAGEALGCEVTRALSGRPVMFVGAETEADNDFAVGRLRTAYLQAGFTEVEFAMEPVAAAYAYQSTAGRDELLLIGDFGGGTTDFSLLRVGPETRGGGGSCGAWDYGCGYCRRRVRCADCATADFAGTGIGDAGTLAGQAAAGSAGVDLCQPGALAHAELSAHA